MVSHIQNVARSRLTIHGAMLRIGYGGDEGGGYSRVDPGGQPWGSGRGPLEKICPEIGENFTKFSRPAITGRMVAH